MAKRKGPADYHALAKGRGFEWRGLEVFSVMSKTEWKCGRGHKFETAYHSLSGSKQGGCPHCAGNMRKMPADYRALAEKRRFKWLGPGVPNAHAKTWWVCDKGHRWETGYHCIQQGYGCPECARGRIIKKLRKKSVDYHILAEKRGFKWLGTEVINTAAKTKWECQEGHCWESSYDNIRGGSGCPHCYGNTPKTIEDYCKLAEARGFKWAGKKLPENVSVKTSWECLRGHEWEARYGDIQRGGGCPYCAGKASKTIENYYKLAEERGFEWVGREIPPGVLTKSLWRCSKNHEWEATYSSIQRGTGCPHCVDIVNGHRVSKLQRQLCETLGGELNYPRGSYRIDIALLDEMIAVEYDSWYWHGNRLEDSVERDKELLSTGWKILHIKSNNELPLQHQLEGALNLLRNGEVLTEIVLGDWGKGPMFVSSRT